MHPTTSSFNPQPRLSLDSGLGLTNDSIYSSDLNETQLMDISAATASDTSSIVQSGPLEYSPPTKWARVRTPPNRKKSALEDVKQEVLPPGFNLFSPPSRKKIKRSFTSPTSSLKTPESLRKSIRISSPSPFKVTFSKTPLKLSNNENVTGIHISRSGTFYNKRVTGSASKRCLLPSKPDGFTFLGSPNSDVLDFPLLTAFDEFGDLPTESPTKNILDMDDGPTDYHQYAGMIESGSILDDYTHSSGPLLESNMRNIRSTPIVRTASRNLLKSNKATFGVDSKNRQVPGIKEELPECPVVTEKPKRVPGKKELSIKSKKQIEKEAMLKEAKEKEMKVWKMAPFETPKKEVPLYSGRWLVISTGRTLAQQELFSDARNFFRSHRPSISAPEAIPSAQKIPTIARVTLFKNRYRSLRA